MIAPDPEDIVTSEINAHLSEKIFNGSFGLEKENVRVTDDGCIASTPHPRIFGHKLKHPYITTDFSESQVEMVTPPLDSISEALGFLETIHDEVSTHLDGEYLWSQSAPPSLPAADEDIPLAQYCCDGSEQTEYREYLSENYGRKKQLFCGIHFNFSFEESELQYLYDQQADPKLSYASFREQIYLKTLRNFKRQRWFLVSLLGNSPAVHESYTSDCVSVLPERSYDTKHHTFAVSMRNGVCGYRNKEDLRLNYDTIEAFQKSMAQRIQQGSLQSDREHYASIRIKFTGSSEKISHLEVRLLDLNPFFKLGIDERHAQIIHQFLIYCLLAPEQERLDEVRQVRGFDNHERAATTALNPDAKIIDDHGNEVLLQQELEAIFESLKSTVGSYLPDHYRDSLNHLESLVREPASRPAVKNLQHIKDDSLIGWSMQQARLFLAESRQSAYIFHGLEDMELSTQLLLRKAVLHGIEIDILDRVENFVKLTKRDQCQYVQQATRTSLDNYVSVLIMENKVVTKKILDSAGILTPSGREYHDGNAAKNDFPYYRDQAIVIKPKSTNFGLGITILKQNSDQGRFEQAVDIALKHDNTLLIESFVSGKEYRIFIINDKVVGILHRVPANVVGDGVSCIEELIAEKNKDPLRGIGYRKPLEKIATGEEEALFLETQGMDFKSIPEAGQTIYLRENSNISTGGDSIDFTEDVPVSYQSIALKAAKALDVKITGLDMMIDDIQQEATDDNYAIIEMNFNPAIHIHCHPYQGKNRHLDAKVLDALFPHEAGTCSPQ